MPIKRLVVDVLIPHDLDILVYVEKISELGKNLGVNVHVLEHDEKTKTAEMTMEGEAVPFEDIKKVIEDLGGSIHSIDQVFQCSQCLFCRGC